MEEEANQLRREGDIEGVKDIEAEIMKCEAGLIDQLEAALRLFVGPCWRTGMTDNDDLVPCVPGTRCPACFAREVLEGPSK